MLADLGADVVKIEPPGGEVTRGTEPDRAFRPYDFVNRNKRAIAVDLHSPEGADVVRRLAETTDIFVENYRPGVLEKLGLGYERLAEINPRIIYCSISGFGLTGPYRERGGFDLVAQAMSGIMSCTGAIGSETPTAAGVPISDLNAGVFGALAVLAAVNRRHVTGRGQHVESSLLESAISYTVWETGVYLTEGTIAAPAGTRHRLSAPYEALKTQDGHIVVGVSNQRLWDRFCQALETPELHADPLFATAPSRVVNRDQLHDRIVEITSLRPTTDWVERLGRVGVPCGPINNVAQASVDPQVIARELFVDVEGRRFVRAPMSLSDSPVSIRRGPAEVGEHTREVLLQNGFAPAEIDRLVTNGTLTTAKEA